MSDRETSGPEAGLFFIDQHGCAKNQVDAELIAARLIEMGWRMTDDPARAVLIVVNSCGFIESAKKESIEAVLTARAAYPGARVVLAGCLAERYADEFRDGLPEADAFFGNGDLSRVGEVVSALFPAGNAAAGAKATVAGVTSLAAADLASGAPEGVLARPSVVPPQRGVCAGDRPLLFSFPRSAYVKITEGCDNRCSFCAIPLIRGGLRSRPAGEIVDEIRVLASRGVFEFNLIGQDLAAYGSGLDDDVGNLAGEGSPLSRLVRAISTLDGDFRVRLLYVHPDHFPADLVPAMAADPRFLPYFDIPFQSGDPAILRAMNRRGTAEGYRSLVETIRRGFREAGSPYGAVALRTTFLVGFPGETDESFERSASLLADLRPLWSGAFTWSREEGTPAASLKGRVAKRAAESRLARLKEAQTAITMEELSFFVGRRVEVLIEELIEGDAGSADEASGAAHANGESGSSDAGARPPAERLAIGRAWFQAPEVDGAVVLSYEEGTRDRDGKPLEPGSVVMADIVAVNGVDVEAVAR